MESKKQEQDNKPINPVLQALPDGIEVAKLTLHINILNDKLVEANQRVETLEKENKQLKT